MRKTILDRFWLKVEKTETCWLWTGAKTKGGHATYSHVKALVQGALDNG